MTYKRIPVFDTLSHPTLNGNWFGKDCGNTFENLKKEFHANDIIGTCAVSLPPMTNEELQSFYTRCTSEKEIVLYPVAAFNFSEENYEDKIRFIRDTGFKAVKIHIRLSGLKLDEDFDKLAEVFRLCEQYGLVVFFCTYCHTSIDYTPPHPLSYYLISLLKQAPKLKIILLHGGDVSLLQISQLARFNPNILIDLSYTMLKFAGSSVDQDIVFLMNNLDRKICLGSDYPDYTIGQFRERVDGLLNQVIDPEKIERICSGNIQSFLEIGI